jgi:hypothetical protein
LMLQRNTITLTFTDKPLPPSSAAEAKPVGSSSEGSILNSLWDSIQRAAGLGGDESEE